MARTKQDSQKSATITIKVSPELKAEFKELAGSYGMGKLAKKYLNQLLKEYGLETM